MQKLLSSHAPWAPCRHGGPDLSHTEWSAIALPRSNRLLVSNGPPCQAGISNSKSDRGQVWWGADRGRQFVYSTNLYASEALRDADMRSADSKPICHYRTGYLRWIEENSPPRSLVDMQKLLSSHAPWAPCRHGGPDLSHTEWSAIALPKSNRLLVSNGPPCQAEYQQFEVG